MIRLLLLLTTCMLSSLGCMSTKSQNLKNSLYTSDFTGIRWGLLVTNSEGKVLVSERPDDRFSPASNTKIVTTIAAYKYMDLLLCRNNSSSTYAVLEPNETNNIQDVVIIGKGDVFLSDDAECETNCLANLVDDIANSGVTRVNNVIGDDTWFPDQRWSNGWSWEDLQYAYGTAVSALNLNDNTLVLNIRPGRKIGDKIVADWENGNNYYDLLVAAKTVPADSNKVGLSFERIPGTKTVFITGDVPIGAEHSKIKMGLDDPAHFVATRFKELLEDRQIQIVGDAIVRHRNFTPEGGLAVDQGHNISACEQTPPLPNSESPSISALINKIKVINKDSQNLYAEVLLRQLGKISGNGSLKDGLSIIDEFLSELDLDHYGYDLYDGSGMSVYNRVSPRVIVTLLNYASRQAWGPEWKRSLPIGSVDGGLKNRFKGTVLEGKITAKTGTLKGVNALSGYMQAASGKSLTFSIIANDRPLVKQRSVIPLMDKVLVEIAMDF